MTWILGSGIPFGYAALVSDVRVSWPDGRTLDRLQKVHPIGAGLIAGFAGSVEVGFWMIDLMQRQWGAAPGTLCPVKYMAWHWHRFARWFYRERVPDRFRPLGCELLIAGVSPESNGFGRFSNAVVMRAPEFNPEVVRPFTWGSIGSGVNHVAANGFANPGEPFPRWIDGEVGRPGGAARAFAHLVASDLEQQPIASVSPILQVATVRPETWEILNLRRDHRGAWTVGVEEPPRPGELVASKNEFRQLSGTAGLDADAAVT